MAGDSEHVEEKPEGSFEKELESLERAVSLLERGDLSLDEMIRQYEAGHQSLKRCYKILEGAQKRIEVLSSHSLEVPAVWRLAEAGTESPGGEDRAVE